jgi:hypothetical protein
MSRGKNLYAQGWRALCQWYREECLAYASLALREAHEHKREIRDTMDEILDAFDAVVTTKARLVIALSDHADAYENEMGAPAPDDPTRAYFAMRADILEYASVLREGDNGDGDGGGSHE